VEKISKHLTAWIERLQHLKFKEKLGEPYAIGSSNFKLHRLNIFVVHKNEDFHHS